MLGDTLAQAFDAHQDEILAQADMTDQEAKRAEEQLLKLQSQIRELAGSRNLSNQDILADMQSLREKIRSTEQRMATDEAMAESIVQRIVQTKQQIDKQLAGDTVTEQLNGIMKSTAILLQSAEKQFQAGVVSAADLSDVREKLARARIELIERQEAVTNAAGGSRLESYESKLADMAMEKNLSLAQLDDVKKQLDESQDLLADADTYELLMLKLEIAKQNFQESLLARDRTDRDTRMLQEPKITVIGAQ